jgi:hypothetical protein
LGYELQQIGGFIRLLSILKAWMKSLQRAGKIISRKRKDNEPQRTGSLLLF